MRVYGFSVDIARACLVKSHEDPSKQQLTCGDNSVAWLEAPYHTRGQRGACTVELSVYGRITVESRVYGRGARTIEAARNVNTRTQQLAPWGHVTSKHLLIMFDIMHDSFVRGHAQFRDSLGEGVRLVRPNFRSRACKLSKQLVVLTDTHDTTINPEGA